MKAYWSTCPYVRLTKRFGHYGQCYHPVHHLRTVHHLRIADSFAAHRYVALCHAASIWSDGMVPARTGVDRSLHCRLCPRFPSVAPSLFRSMRRLARRDYPMWFRTICDWNRVLGFNEHGYACASRDAAWFRCDDSWLDQTQQVPLKWAQQSHSWLAMLAAQLVRYVPLQPNSLMHERSKWERLQSCLFLP